MINLTRWILYSPRNFVAAAVTGLVALVLIGVGLSAIAPHRPGGARTDVAAADQPSRAPFESDVQVPQKPEAAERERVLTARAETFTLAWLNTDEGQVVWWQGVQPLVTDEYAPTMQTTNADAIPDTYPVKFKVAYASDYSAVVLVTLANDDQVTVTMAAVGEDWKVSHLAPGDQT